MSPDRARSIAARQLEDEMNGDCGEYPREKHEDRGALLDLLKRMPSLVTRRTVKLAGADITVNHCLGCQRYSGSAIAHALECSEPALEALRGR